MFNNCPAKMAERLLSKRFSIPSALKNKDTHSGLCENHHHNLAPP